MNTLLIAAIRCALMFLVPALAYAGSAQWNLNPTSGDWNTAHNWTPMTVPNGPADTATFALSNTTNVSISANTEVNAIIALAAASSYTITATPGVAFTLSGAGIVNNSSSRQNFVTAADGAGNRGQTNFTNSASAGNSAVFTNNSSVAQFVQGGETAFYNNSNAANGTFANQGGTLSGSEGGTTSFHDSSTAGSGNFTNSGGTTPNASVSTSATLFSDTSTAGNGVFTNDGGAAYLAGGGQTIFFDTSTAAAGNFINNGATASGGFGGAAVFDDNSSAGSGSFTNNGGTPSGVFALGGGNTIFLKTSTAANATFINNGATTSDGEGGVTEFGIFPSAEVDSPTAANATFINNGATVGGAVGGRTVFYETSAADFATLIANSGTAGGGGGQIFFSEASAGGTPRIELFGNGSLDVSGHNAPGVMIGSIEGDGDVFLGANNLTVGSNNLTTSFSGVIQDGGAVKSLVKLGTLILDVTEANMHTRHTVNRGVLKVYGCISSNTFVIQDGGFGGSLTKIGTGTLDLTGANTYTGVTNINRGVLRVDGSISSDTFVNHGGALAGSGTVNGNITNNNRGIVSPGNALGVPGVLTVENNYTQARGATLLIQIAGPNAGQVSVLNVLGNANLNGFLDPVLVNGFVPDIGQSFTFMNYASFTGFFSHIKDQPFDHGRKRWLLAYNPTSAILIAIKNGSRSGGTIDNTGPR